MMKGTSHDAQGPPWIILCAGLLCVLCTIYILPITIARSLNLADGRRYRPPLEIIARPKE